MAIVPREHMTPNLAEGRIVLDIGNDRYLEPAVGRVGRRELARREVKEHQLYQRRRIAKELDVTLHNRTRNAVWRALHPGTGDTDDDRKNQAGDGQPDGVVKTTEQPIPLALVVEKDEVPLKQKPKIQIKKWFYCDCD